MFIYKRCFLLRHAFHTNIKTNNNTAIPHIMTNRHGNGTSPAVLVIAGALAMRWPRTISRWPLTPYGVQVSNVT